MDSKTFVAKVNKEMGREALMLPTLDSMRRDVEVFSTGLAELDSALGVGGWPKGRIIEIMGEEASGKSTLALHAIAEAQKKDMTCSYIDTEHAIDRTRAEAIGVNFDNLPFSQPDNAEDALDLLEYLCFNGSQLVVVDSVAALVPQAELEGEMRDATIGLQARLMGKALRKITPIVSKKKVCVIFINQLRDKIGGWSPMPQKIGSGGNALKFYSSIRIEMKKTGTSRTKDFYTTHKIIVRKNKLAIPMRTVECKCSEKGLWTD